jgi:hypothetical protein
MSDPPEVLKVPGVREMDVAPVVLQLNLAVDPSFMDAGLAAKETITGLLDDQHNGEPMIMTAMSRPKRPMGDELPRRPARIREQEEFIRDLSTAFSAHRRSCSRCFLVYEVMLHGDLGNGNRIKVTLMLLTINK